MSLQATATADNGEPEPEPPLPSPSSQTTLWWVAAGLAFVIFGIVDLILVLLLPANHRMSGLVTSLMGAAIVIVLLPLLLAQFERQQERIEWQRREILLLHAMDIAILSEMDLSRLLGVALRSAIRAVDAEAGGVALFHPRTGKLLAEEYEAVGLGSREQDRLRGVTRSGRGSTEDEWDTVIVPLGMAGPGSTVRIDGEPLTPIRNKRTGEVAPANAEPNGYLAVVRRHRPGQPGFVTRDADLLETFRQKVDVAIANARAQEAARDSVRIKEELVREKRVARALTESLLPDIPAQVGEWRFARRYEAQSAEALVGGDIYDLFSIGDGIWGVMIADVSGKGLAAAQKTAMVKYSLRSYAREHTSPAAVLYRLNNALFEEPDLTGFVTLFYGVLDESDGSLIYASAGHETPVLCRADAACAPEMLNPTGIVLGAAPDQPYQETRIYLTPGDSLLLYTDGLSEARSQTDGHLLDVSGVVDLLHALRETDSRRPVTDLVWEAVTEYTGGKMRDDTALLWIGRVAVPSETAELAPPVAIGAGL